MSNLAQSISFDHAPSELSPEAQGAVDVIVARGGSLLSPFAADQISAHGSTPAIDDDVIRQLRDAGIIPAAERCDAMTPYERAIASAGFLLEIAEHDLAQAQEREAQGNDHDRKADEASERHRRRPSLGAAFDARDHGERAAEDRRQARERLASAERLTAVARAIRERAEARREAFLAAARQSRVILSRATHAPQRSTREPRRRVSRTAAAATRAGPSDGGDPDPEPSSRVLVCQQTAPAVLGWSGRRFIEFVRRKGVRHTIDRRRIVALLGDVLTALGLDAPPAAKSVEPIASDWRARAELKLVGGSRGAR
jgi:hypothetical protein